MCIRDRLWNTVSDGAMNLQKRNARSKAISEELFRKSSALSKTNVPFLKISQKNKIGKLFWFDLTLNEAGNML